MDCICRRYQLIRKNIYFLVIFPTAPASVPILNLNTPGAGVFLFKSKKNEKNEKKRIFIIKTVCKGTIIWYIISRD